MKTKVVKADELHFDFEAFDLTIDDFPGCCSLGVVNGFPSDGTGLEGVYEDAVVTDKEDCRYDIRDYKYPTFTEAKPAMLKALTEAILQHNDGLAQVIVLSDKQKFAQEATLKAGYKKVGAYTGREGVITIFQKGLRLPRRLVQTER